jgi:nicotinamide-nucleotide amidase
VSAEIIAVGTEILLGDIVNTNAQYISQELAKLGIDVYFQSVVGDNPKRLEDTIYKAFERADIVITSGGLGPTRDDITKEICAKYFEKDFVRDEKAYEMLEAFFTKIGKEMTENNIKQIMVPEGSIVMYNHNGTAPGVIMEGKGKILIMLPGPPRELIPMFQEYAVPFLKSKSEYTFVSRVLRVAKLGESKTEYMLRDLIESQTNPTIATYVKNVEAVVRITAKAKSEEEAKALIEPVAQEIYRRFGKNVYAEGDKNIRMAVCEELLEKNITVACAESCTGGMVASAFTDYPGISQVFIEGAVTYCNDAKMRRLGVKAETLEKYDAVSAETAMEMAEGIAKTSGAEIGVSTTGVAGPGGGTPERPVGLVYVGFYRNGKAKAVKLNYPGLRETVRTRAVDAVFNIIRNELEGLEYGGE